MFTVHEILYKLSLEGDHSMTTSAYGLVKAYTNFDVEHDALNIEMAIKTKGVVESISCYQSWILKMTYP
uniref:Uncharacterized protein n=2 Tax=Ursus TaxID=9639 RepID=A0A452UYL0_URSMA